MGNVTLQFARGDFSAYLEQNIKSLKERVYLNFRKVVVNTFRDELGLNTSFDFSEFTDFDSFYDKVCRFINNDLPTLPEKYKKLTHEEISHRIWELAREKLEMEWEECGIADAIFPSGSPFLQTVGDTPGLIFSFGKGTICWIPCETIKISEWLKPDNSDSSKKVIDTLKSPSVLGLIEDNKFSFNMFHGYWSNCLTAGILYFPTATDKAEIGELRKGDYWLYKGDEIRLSKAAIPRGIQLLDAPDIIKKGDLFAYQGCGKWVIQAEKDKMTYSST